MNVCRADPGSAVSLRCGFFYPSSFTYLHASSFSILFISLLIFLLPLPHAPLVACHVWRIKKQSWSVALCRADKVSAAATKYSLL